MTHEPIDGRDWCNEKGEHCWVGGGHGSKNHPHKCCLHAGHLGNYNDAPKGEIKQGSPEWNRVMHPERMPDNDSLRKPEDRMLDFIKAHTDTWDEVGEGVRLIAEIRNAVLDEIERKGKPYFTERGDGSMNYDAFFGIIEDMRRE